MIKFNLFFAFFLIMFTSENKSIETQEGIANNREEIHRYDRIPKIESNKILKKKLRKGGAFDSQEERSDINRSIRKNPFIINNMNDLKRAIKEGAKHIRLNLTIANLQNGNLSFAAFTPENLKNIKVVEVNIPNTYDETYENFKNELIDFFNKATHISKIIVSADVFLDFYLYFPAEVREVQISDTVTINDDIEKIMAIKEIAKDLLYTVQIPLTLREVMAERRRHRELGE